MPLTINVSQRSKRVMYASNCGAALNSNRTSGGGTDDTAALQAVLNYFGTIGGGTLFIEGDALFSQLVIPTNTTVDMMNNGSLFSKAGSVTGPIIMNKDVVAGTSGAPTDTCIAVANGYINGNRVGGHGNAALYLDGNSGTARFLPLIGIAGCTHLTLENLHLYESPCYNIQLSNCQYFNVSNIRVNVLSGDETAADFQDGVHLNGYCSNFSIRHIRGETNDDFAALNADDGFTSSADPQFGWGQPGMSAGPIQDGLIEDVVSLDGASKIRLLSGTQLIDRIRIKGCAGSIQGSSILIASLPEAGTGNFGTINVEGDQTQVDNTNTAWPATCVNVAGNVNCLRLSNFQQQMPVYGSTNITPIVQLSIPPGGSNAVTVNQLSINGLDIYDTLYDRAEIVSIPASCTVNQLLVNGVNWLQAFTGTGALIDGAGSLYRLTVGNYIGPPRIIGSTIVPNTLSGDAFLVAPRISAYVLGANSADVVTLIGVGFATVSGVTVNGIAASSFTINNDRSLSVTLPTASSGMIAITNAFGSTSYPFVVGGFVDTFNRSNRALNGDNGWALQVSGNAFTFTIANDILNMGYDSPGNDIITNSGESFENGWAQAIVTLVAAGAGFDIIMRSSGGASWSGYACVFDLNSVNQPYVALYKVTSGTYAQVGSNTDYSMGLMPPNVRTLCSVHAVAGVFTFYINGIQVAQYTDGSPYTTAGACGLRQDNGSGGDLNNASRFCSGFACGT